MIEKTLSVATSLDQMELRKAVFSLSGELKTLDGTFALDETGGQIAVFGRLGSRPFTWDEMKKFYQRPDGSVWTVRDDVRSQDFLPARTVAGKPSAAPPPTKQ